ncbi:uncharacterized protein LOC100367801 [Saccoglossus kowalevskii]|uniref:Uncharacterized protein LOC100367801 n=1 Tax=Saccoglossus kowalevskii TaxID=10224 RepID=A0ABM0GJ51_SACKO|nr:PREDICTED: uncharacterized protein LOC100367801 [Saccoglossus kowalevskii]
MNILYFYAIGVLLVFWGINGEFEHPECVVIDSNSSVCLDIFFDYWDGFQSNGSTDYVNHQWIRYLGSVYDYNNEDYNRCYIRQEAADESRHWTRHGYSTCTSKDVKTFNKWWEKTCEDSCGLEDNCGRYSFYLGQHLWKNCTWNKIENKPDYDLYLP